MKIKAVAIDLDGTLLNSKHEISEFNLEVIEKLKREGVMVMISTGRLYSSLYKYKEKLKLDTPVICYNGAKVVDGKNDETIFEINLNEDAVKKIVEVARKNDVHLNLFQEEKWYVECRRNEVETYAASSGLKYHLINFDELNKIKVTKAMYVGENAKLKEIEKEIKDSIGEDVYMAFSKPYFLEILDKKVSKGEALKSVLEKYNISREETAAFGDGFNDAEMLSFAGVGVVMGNAPEELKKQFKNVADTNDNDGLGKYILKLIEEK